MKDWKEAIHPSIIQAAIDGSNALTRLDIRHVLVGGLAVAAHGYSRATKDVDFLVGDEAFEHYGRIISFKPGVPLFANGVVIDILPAEDGYLEVALNANHKIVDGLAVIDKKTLIVMKLLAGRRRDLGDIEGLINMMSEPEIARICEYVSTVLPDKLEKLLTIIHTDEV